MKADLLSRRKLVVAAGLTGLGAAAAETARADAPNGSHRVDLSGPYLDVMSPPGSLLAHARLSGNIDPSRKRFDWFDGQVMAVAPSGNVTPLVSVRGYIEMRLTPMAGKDGWRLRRHLFATYYDPNSGQALSELHNTLNGECVRVSHVSGAVADGVVERNPALHWRQNGANFDLHHSAQVAFASGSDAETLTGLSVTSHIGAIADLQDAALTTVRDVGTWTLVTGWLPWLNMGHTPGHCVFQCTRGGGMEVIAELPSQVIAGAAEADIA